MAQREDTAEVSVGEPSDRNPRLPCGWIAHMSTTYPGNVYYFNTYTGATTWKIPQLLELEEESRTSQKKKKQHGRKLCKEKGLCQEATAQSAGQVSVDALHEDHVLDTTCDNNLYSFKPSSSHSDKAAGQTGKDHWKKLWDSPSSKRRKVDSSFSKGDCGLSAEDVKFFRFPNGNVGKVLSVAKAAYNTPVKTSGSESTEGKHSGQGSCLLVKDSLQKSVRSVHGKAQTLVCGDECQISAVSGPSVADSSVEVQYMFGVKKTRDSHTCGQPTGREGVGRELEAPSATNVEFSQSVKTSRTASAKQGTNLSQVCTSADGLLEKRNTSQVQVSPHANRLFVPRVLSAARSASTSQVTCSASLRSGVSVGDVNTGSSDHIVDAQRTGCPTGTVAGNAAGKSRVTKQQCPLIPETSGGSASSAGGAAGPIILGEAESFALRTPVSRKKEMAVGKLSTTQAGDAQGEYSVCKSKSRKRKRSNSLSADNGSCSDIAQDSPGEPASSAFSLVHGQYHHEASPPYSTQGGLSRHNLTCIAAECSAKQSSSQPSGPQSQSTEQSNTVLDPSVQAVPLASNWTKHSSFVKTVSASGVILDASEGPLSASELTHNAFPIMSDGASAVGTVTSSMGDREMDMEIDNYSDVCDIDNDQIMLDLQELREKFQPDMKAKALGLLTESVEKTQTLRPTTPNFELANLTQLVYFVVDTNIFIEALTFLRRMRDMLFKGHSLPCLIIPWVVLQELDGLKMSKLRSLKAQNAVRYIHSCLVKHHPRVHGQTPAKALEPVEGLEIQCNDDRILHCCLQCQKKYNQDSVFLLTNDLNLQNKAFVMGINSFSNECLEPLLTKPDGESHYAALESSTAHAGALAEGGRVTRLQSLGQRDGDNGMSTSVPGHSGRCTPVPGHSRLCTPVHSMCSERRETVHRSENSTPSSGPCQQRAAAQELLCSGKEIVRLVLSEVLEKEMKAVFEDLWTEIVYRKPPWSPYEALLTFQKHWIAVFSLKFSRELKPAIDSLVKEFRPGQGVSQEPSQVLAVLQNCLQVIAEVSKLSSGTDSVNKMTALVQKGTALLQECTENTASSTDGLSGSVTVQTPSGRDSGTNLQSSVTRLRTSDLTKAAAASSHSSSSSTATSSFCTSSSAVPITRTASSLPLNHGSTASALGSKDGTVKRDRRVALETEAQSSSGESSSAEEQRMSSALSQVPETNTAEETAAIGETFQGVWSAIHNCCQNVEKLMISPSLTFDLQNVKDTLVGLVPHVLHLHEAFEKCLSISPLLLDQQMDSVSELCSCLNTFFHNAGVPACPLTPVAPSNMIVFMRCLDNRIPLATGLQQLQGMITTLQQLIAQLSSA